MLGMATSLIHFLPASFCQWAPRLFQPVSAFIRHPPLSLELVYTAAAQLISQRGFVKCPEL